MSFIRSPHVHAGLWAATIAVLMMMPAEDLQVFDLWLPLSLEQWIDKVQHVFAFMVMVILLARSLSESDEVQRPVLRAVILTLGFSFFLEALQSLVPWRYFDPKDLVADTVGVLMALPIATRYARRTKPGKVHQ